VNWEGSSSSSSPSPTAPVPPLGRGRCKRGDSREIAAPDHPDVLTAASTISPSLVRPTLRHHDESALKSLISSGPTRLALSVLALPSAPMMFSDSAGSTSRGSGLGVRRLPTADAAPGVALARSRIRTIVSCGRTTITTSLAFLRLRPPRPSRLARDLAALLGCQFLRPSFAAETC
jgi:hypothetical protein